MLIIEYNSKNQGGKELYNRQLERKKMKRVNLYIFTCVILLSTSSIAALSFDGKEMQLTYLRSTQVYDSTNFIVGSGIEVYGYPDTFPGIAPTNIDISGYSIEIDYIIPSGSGAWSSSTASVFHFFDVSGTIEDIVSVSINSATNMSGFDASRVTFDEDNIFIDWSGLSFGPDSLVMLACKANP